MSLGLQLRLARGELVRERLRARDRLALLCQRRRRRRVVARLLRGRRGARAERRALVAQLRLRAVERRLGARDRRLARLELRARLGGRAAALVERGALAREAAAARVGGMLLRGRARARGVDLGVERLQLLPRRGGVGARAVALRKRCSGGVARVLQRAGRGALELLELALLALQAPLPRLERGALLRVLRRRCARALELLLQLALRRARRRLGVGQLPALVLAAAACARGGVARGALLVRDRRLALPECGLAARDVLLRRLEQACLQLQLRRRAHLGDLRLAREPLARRRKLSGDGGAVRRGVREEALLARRELRRALLEVGREAPQQRVGARAVAVERAAHARLERVEAAQRVVLARGELALGVAQLALAAGERGLARGLFFGMGGLGLTRVV